MGWARFDDRRHENAKLIKVGLECDGLHARATTYSSGHLTDGFIDTAVMQHLAGVRHWRKLADRLTDQGLLVRDDSRDGWTVVNYLEFNPTRESVLVKLEADRIRKDSGRNRQGRDSRGRKTSARNPDGIQTESEDCPPVPSHPIPSVEPKGSTSATSSQKSTDDPVKARAHKLTVLAFEQPVKPDISGDQRGAFPAAMSLIERRLRAGVPANVLASVIQAGVEVWTLAGIQTAEARIKERPARSTNPTADRIKQRIDRLRDTTPSLEVVK